MAWKEVGEKLEERKKKREKREKENSLIKGKREIISLWSHCFIQLKEHKDYQVLLILSEEITDFPPLSREEFFKKYKKEGAVYKGIDFSFTGFDSISKMANNKVFASELCNSVRTALMNCDEQTISSK